MKSVIKIIVLSSILIGIGFIGQAVAGNAGCNAYYAADGSYQTADSDQIVIIDHAEPDLPAISTSAKPKKVQKSSTNFFSWLTKSHTMPNLHFIEFIELFGEENG